MRREEKGKEKKAKGERKIESMMEKKRRKRIREERTKEISIDEIITIIKKRRGKIKNRVFKNVENQHKR